MRKRISALVLVACIAIFSCGVMASAAGTTNGYKNNWNIDYVEGYPTSTLTSTTFDVNDGDNYYTLNCSSYNCTGGNLFAKCTTTSAESKTFSGTGSWMLKYLTLPGVDKAVNFSVTFKKSGAVTGRYLSSGKVYA